MLSGGVGTLIADLAPAGITVALGWFTAWIAKEAILHMREAAHNDTETAIRDLRGDPFDPSHSGADLPELMSDDEVGEAIQQAAADGLIEPETARHDFPDLFTPEQMDSAVAAADEAEFDREFDDYYDRQHGLR